MKSQQIVAPVVRHRDGRAESPLLWLLVGSWGLFVVLRGKFFIARSSLFSVCFCLIVVSLLLDTYEILGGQLTMQNQISSLDGSLRFGLVSRLSR